MGVLREVIARLHAVRERCAQAGEALDQGYGLLEEANTECDRAIAGTRDAEGNEVLRLLAHGVAELNDICRAMVALGRRIQICTSSFEPIARGVTGFPQCEPPARAPERTPPVVRSEHVEQLRQQLPPPVVRNSGQKTHGRWVAPDGSAQSTVSGVEELTARVNDVLTALGCAMLPARAAADVELKLAALMRDRGPTDPAMRHITLVINN